MSPVNRIRALRLSGAVFVAVVFVAALAVPPARAIDITSVTSSKGITAWLIQDKTVPLVSMRFAFRGGSALDPKGKGGLAEMTTGLLDEGAANLDSDAFQKKLSDDSIDLGFSAGLDSAGGSLKTLNRNRTEAFNLLHDALTAPRFDNEPVSRVRRQMLAAVRRDAERPQSIADDKWHKAVFGDHPYARDTDGNRKTIPQITVADMRGWVKHHFARDNLVVGVVGDITPDQLKPLLDRAFGDLPAKATLPKVPDAKLVNKDEVLVVHRDIPQTVVMFGQKGIARDNPDFYAATLMNYVMGGGGLTSRLADEVREKRGLAYSVYTALVDYDHAPLIMGWVATKNARVKESMDLIREQWRKMAEHGITKSELADAKSYIKGAYYTHLTSTSRIADALVGIQLDHLGIDYLDRRKGLIDAVTLVDVARVAKRLLDADKLTVVMVGNPKGVTPTQ